MTETTGSLLLEAKNLTKIFGALAAVDDVSITVNVGERRALIGPNGAGKSTLFQLINGQLTPTNGSITFRGKDITATSVHSRVREGMAMTFQRSNLLDDLTVEQNLHLAIQRAKGEYRRWFIPAHKIRSVTDRVEEVLDTFALTSDARAITGSLAHGRRRSLEIALAYSLEPSLLLLDEPAAGMSPGEIEQFLELLDSLQGVTFVMIEHNVDLVLRFASKITVLDAGSVIAEGAPEQIVNSAEVQTAYLGSSRERKQS